MVRAAILMVVYAVLLAALGVLTFMLRPPGADAVTALVIPAAGAVLMLACAAATVIGNGRTAEGKPKTLGMIGVHAGMVVPLIMLLGVLGRAIPGTGDFLDARAASAQTESPSEALAREVLEGEERSLIRETLARDYQLAGLWGISALSVMAAAGIISLRPRVAKPEFEQPAA